MGYGLVTALEEAAAGRVGTDFSVFIYILCIHIEPWQWLSWAECGVSDAKAAAHSLGGPSTQGWDRMVIVGQFQLGIFCISVI